MSSIWRQCPPSFELRLESDKTSEDDSWNPDVVKRCLVVQTKEQTNPDLWNVGLGLNKLKKYNCPIYYAKNEVHPYYLVLEGKDYLV